MEDKKDEATVLNTDIEHSQKEENKQNNKEQKQQDIDDKKKTLRTVVIAVICTLLFIVILLLLVLLGTKQCSRATNSGLSSSEQQSSAPRYDYDNEKLDNKFKAIVKGYMDGPGCLDPDNLLEVKAVTYVDNYNDGYFSLNTSVTGENNKLYLYKANKVFYPEDKFRFDNLISYLLLDSTPDVFIDGDLETEFSCNIFIPTEAKITTDKKCEYVISNNIAGTSKYFDGFYFESNQYNVYHHQQLISNNPFNEQADLVVDINHPLYGYYQRLSI